jgi:hypothetical protein
MTKFDLVINQQTQARRLNPLCACYDFYVRVIISACDDGEETVRSRRSAMN